MLKVGVHIMKRNEIEEHLKWDLSGLFKNREEFEKMIAAAEREIAYIASHKGALCESEESFIAYMEADERLSRYVDNLYCYASSSCDVEPENQENQLMFAKAYDLYNKCGVELNFVSLELIANKEKVEEYLKSAKCADFKYPMEELFRTIPHRLEAREEELLAAFSDIEATPAKIYSSLRLEFPDVMVDGKPQFLNGATLREFLQHKDVEVRKSAFENYYNEYKRFENPISNMLIGNAKVQVLEAKLRHHNSALEASLFEDGATKELFDKVLEMGEKKYLPYFHEYNALKKDILGLDELHFYDLNVPLVNSVDKKYSVEECFEILKKALLPLGDDYVKMLDVAREERWIDFMTHTGKRSGAYSSGTYDSNPFILTNFTGNYDSLSTLAHEFGHSMHSYYSRKHNRPMLANYRIFVAEVASTVNEVLLNEYLLSSVEDEGYKAYLRYNFLEQLVGTLYRQPMFADFEVKLHEMLEAGKSVSSGVLTEYYMNLSKQYFGKDVVVDDLVAYQGYAVPHMYYNFYVYKYTLGMSIALAFAKRILKGDVEDYLNFLKKGGSESPLDELKHANVNPLGDCVYDEAFMFFKESLDAFKKSVKK